MRRLTATTLLVAFALVLLAPVRAAWSCPDGTPCVHDRSHGFACAETKCSSHASSCCVARSVRCKHGELPSAERPGSGSASLQAPDHCRYSVSAAPQVPAADPSARQLWPVVAALTLPAPFRVVLAPARPAWRAEYTLGYRPPPLLTLGPSRAPPSA